MRNYILLFICFTLLAVAYASEDTYIPSVSLDNYWTVHGAPDLSASLAGTNEFERGDTVDLIVDLTNYGRIMGFESDKTPDLPLELALADAEMNYEHERTTALGIVGTLKSTTPNINVESGDQVVESLRSGEKTEDPLKFTIKIADHTAAGEYSLELNLAYDYQYNVEVDASSLMNNELVNFQTSYWYESTNQTVVIPVYVKKESDFVVNETSNDLKAGKNDCIVEVTYKNVGEEPAKDAVARISVFKPFSSTDDQAYIGTLAPGEERAVKFKVDVDKDATVKEYGINSEIKYTNIYGDVEISRSMKIPVTVEPGSRSYALFAIVILILAAAGAALIYSKRGKKEKGESED